MHVLLDFVRFVLSGLLNGIVGLVVAALYPSLRLGVSDFRSLSFSLAVGGYGNSIASFVGAWYGSRGLTTGGSLANQIATSLFSAAVIAILRVVQLLIRGAGES